MRILIGVDDSPHSWSAVEFVSRMSWPKDTKVTVVSVVQPPVLAYAEVAAGTQPLIGATEDLVRARQELSARTEDALRSARLETEAKVLRGDPRIALVEAVREERADLLVVGSHGRSGLAKLVMGSVAGYVLTHAPCSVLVVKSGHSAPL